MTGGAVGVGRTATPSRYRTRPDKCPEAGHPGVTYNPLCDRTWCLCGERTYDGDTTGNQHLACCGGPLTEEINP